MHKFKLWLIGSICAVAVSEMYLRFAAETATCREIQVLDFEDSWSAYCNETDLSEIPQDLNKRLVLLNLTGCKWLTLKKDSFERYPILIWLEMNGLRYDSHEKEPETHQETFMSLTQLNVLMIQYSGYSTKFKWPASITDLMIDNSTKNTDLDISHLSQLRKLSIQDMNLEDIPKIHELAPLKILWAYWNPMRKVTAEKLSHFCLLEEFYLQIEIPENSTTQEFCRCSTIEVWLRAVNLYTYFIASHSCHVDTKRCGINYVDVLNNRRACLLRHGLPDDTANIALPNSSESSLATSPLPSELPSSSASSPPSTPSSSSPLLPSTLFWNMVTYLLPWIVIGILSICLVTYAIIKYIKRLVTSVSTTPSSTIEEAELEEEIMYES